MIDSFIHLTPQELFLLIRWQNRTTGTPKQQMCIFMPWLSVWFHTIGLRYFAACIHLMKYLKVNSFLKCSIRCSGYALRLTWKVQPQHRQQHDCWLTVAPQIKTCQGFSMARSLGEWTKSHLGAIMTSCVCAAPTAYTVRDWGLQSWMMGFTYVDHPRV